MVLLAAILATSPMHEGSKDEQSLTTVSLLTPNEDHRSRCTPAQERAYSGVGVLYARGTMTTGAAVMSTSTGSLIKSSVFDVPEGRYIAMNAHSFYGSGGVPTFPLRGNGNLPDLSLYRFYSTICGQTFSLKRLVVGGRDPSQRGVDYAFAELDTSNQQLCPYAKSLEIRLMSESELSRLEDQQAISTVGYYDPRNVKRNYFSRKDDYSNLIRPEDLQCFYSIGRFVGTLDPPNQTTAFYDGTFDTDHNGSGGPLVFEGGDNPLWSGVHVGGATKANTGILADRAMIEILKGFVKVNKP